MLLTPKELATQWNMSSGTLRKWAAEGYIPGAYKMGRDWRFDSAKVNRWFENREQKPKVRSCQSRNVGNIIGYAFNGTARKSEDRLEQLLGLKPSRMNGN